MSGEKASVRVLITGARGFVGSYLAKALHRFAGADVTIIPTAKRPGEHPAFGFVEALDVTDQAAVSAALLQYWPTHVVHLAGIAAPVAAGSDPDVAWNVHLQGARNLGLAILRLNPDCWLLHVGSGMVYGEAAKSGLPLSEEALLVPVDEYAASKAAADLALGALTKRGLKCVRLRPFNHTGPGQTEAFVVPAFARQIARIEAGRAPAIIRVGNLDAERDFLDVRDVASAYALAVKSCDRLDSDTILNIASGIPRRIANILNELLAQSRTTISVEQDPDRLRPSDLPRIIGDATNAKRKLEWAPEYTFESTLVAVLEDWRDRVAHEATGN
jgi:GDP-4-dehydro-6-deoxy-D-mannose reductase